MVGKPLLLLPEKPGPCAVCGADLGSSKFSEAFIGDELTSVFSFELD